MDPRVGRPTNGLTDGRTTPQPDPGESDPRRIRGSNRATVIGHSQKVVTRRSAAGGNNFNYEVDLWETTPKTDYTYSRSRSYLKQPINDNYISPNMSRRSLHGGSSRFDEHSSAYSLTSKEGIDVTDASSLNSRKQNFMSTVAEDETESYMTLRSRTLMAQRRQPTGGWQSDNTFEMHSMHGTDVEEEVQESVATHSALGNHGNHAYRNRNTFVGDENTLLSRISSFLVTIIQICVTVTTYLPKKAASFFSKLSSAVIGDSSYRLTRLQSETVTMTTDTTSTTETVRTDSLWLKIQDNFWSLISFFIVTLPVGLVSWTVYGIITIVKALRQSTEDVWCWFEKVLYSTVTRTCRVTDAAVMSRTSAPRRHCGCCCLFPLLFLLPFLFIGLFYGYSCQEEMVIIGSVQEQFSAYFPFLRTFSKETENLIKIDEPSTVIASKDARTENVESSEGNSLAIAMLEERMRNVLLKFLADHKEEVQENQDQALASFRSHLNQLVKLLVQRELDAHRNLWNVQISSIKSTAERDRVHAQGEQHKQMTAIAAMRAALDDLAEKSTVLSDDLILLKKSWAQQSEAKPQSSPVEDQRIFDLESHLKRLNQELTFLRTKYEDLTAQISKWPSDEQITLLVKSRIREYFSQIMNDVGSDISLDLKGRAEEAGQVPFGVWLRDHFASRDDDLDRRLAALAANVTKEVNEKILASKDDPTQLAMAVAAIIGESTSKVEPKEETVEKDRRTDGVMVGTSDGTSVLSAPCTLCDGMLTEADVLKLIQTELGIYDADKTGKVDYALESAGGSIISVRCSETYQLRTAQTSVFGIPLWYTYNSPRVVIQPGMQPGECWPFTGSQGYVVVQLSRRIFITEVSIEHIPKSLSPTGTIDSAPKDCEIWGLENETDTVGTFLGAFMYSSDGSPIQTYKLKDPKVASFKFVELKIISNHGNENFTCLYRFRVHGYLDPASE